MAKRSRKNCSGRSKKKLLDFWDGAPRLTDLSSTSFLAVLPIVRDNMPRIHLTLTDKDMHCALNAIAYMAIFHTSWNKVANMKIIQRFYYRLKKLGLLSLLRARAGLPSSLLIVRHTKKTPIEQEEDLPRLVCRPCGPCPRCGQNTMRCYGSHKVGAMRVRHYRCRSCQYAAVWITGTSHSWWKSRSELERLAKKFPTCG